MNAEDPIDLLIAYVEGQMSVDQRAAFEKTLTASPELRRQLELMRQADESIAHSFAAPGFVQVDFNAARATAAMKSRATVSPLRRWGGLAIAATLLIVATLRLTIFADSGRAVLTLSELYDGQVKNGFKPAFVCNNDAEFVDYTQKSFGLPLLAQGDSSVQIVGWTYESAEGYKDLGLSDKAQIVLARVETQPVLLLMDKGNARGPKIDKNARGRLQVFERNVGGVDVFEITPLSKPMVLDRFKVQ